jgi:ubiquitin carboxyl-terminal hydrolase 22/27/51
MLKQQTFAKLPTILCLHLKRFDAAANKKIDDPVSFPAVLDMGSYLPHWREVEQTSVLKPPDTDACDNTQPLILYDLCGTINHSGGMNQGHYVANVKIEDAWYNCNDAHVRALSSVDEVLKNNEVYMIFYTRRNVTLS